MRYTRIAGEISQSVTGYMLGDVLTSLIAGIVVFVTLTVLGVPFALDGQLADEPGPPGLPMPVARCGLWISWMRCLTAVRSVLPCSQRPAVPPGLAGDRKETSMTNDDLQHDVAAELSWDPRVDSQAIAVSAHAGAVTLRGTVGSLRHKREAGKAAARVYGVTEVSNELDVRILDGSKRDDPDLRGDVLQALMLDSLVPMTVDAKVREGFVTLTGTADWQYQRDEAELLTASVPGVAGIDDDITLTSAPDGRDIKNDISAAFRRNARLDADELSVDTPSYGTVILAGAVNSWAEHDEAVAAAWSAPGVTEVDDRILVEY